MLPKNRPPTHPGEMLNEEFLKPLEMSQSQLAAKPGLHVQAINPVIRGRRAVSPQMALRLAKAFGTTPEFWMDLQTRWDL